MSGFKVGDVIATKMGPGKIRRIGPVHHKPEASLHGWAMLTLDVNGEVAYAPAREDEIDWKAPTP